VSWVTQVEMLHTNFSNVRREMQIVNVMMNVWVNVICVHEVIWMSVFDHQEPNEMRRRSND
jgi:hypothetical protein